MDGVPILPDIMPLGPANDETVGVDAPSRMPVRAETVARQFDRRAGRMASHDALLREIGQRLTARFDYIRIDPRRILDVGCGLGRTRHELLKVFPGAEWIGVERSPVMARAGRCEQRGRGLARLWRREPQWIVADGGRLPLADESVDLVYSNLMLHWHPMPHQVFAEWKRVLRTEGLMMFSSFGPDTLQELRAAAATALPHARPVPFIDMHDLGDMMVAAGLASPVMDAEQLTLTFHDPIGLLREVRALGANPRDDRWSALTSGRRARLLIDALDARRGADGRIPLTFEIAYGHAWKPAPRGPAGTGTVKVEVLREQLESLRRPPDQRR
jgi:malonyl-CoA O-methyltransferase